MKIPAIDPISEVLGGPAGGIGIGGGMTPYGKPPDCQARRSAKIRIVSMPLESSWPLVLGCGVGAVAGGFLWLQSPTRLRLVSAAILGIAAIGLGVVDWLVVTDREQLLALFPRLARAAETRDVATLVAAVDPELRPLRAEAERALAVVSPTAVVITRLDVDVRPEVQPPEATARLIVRVTGRVIDPHTPATTLVALTLSLHKKDGVWLVRDAEVDEPRPGR